jgi:hypothetical protein
MFDVVLLPPRNKETSSSRARGIEKNVVAACRPLENGFPAVVACKYHVPVDGNARTSPISFAGVVKTTVKKEKKNKNPLNVTPNSRNR